jgi:hypothetical protein
MAREATVGVDALLVTALPSGCSWPPGFVRAACHPHRRHPDQAALSFTGLLLQDGGEGLSPPPKSTAPHGALGDA